MNIRKKTILTICIFGFLFSVFSNFPPKHTIELSGLLYRFSYSEEFNEPQHPNSYIFGQPRSDEYGATIGAEFSYNFLHKESNLTFGLKLGYSRAVNHTYDGSLQMDSIPHEGGWLYKYEPYMMKNKDNYFYLVIGKIGYLINKTSGRIMYEPKILFSFNAWDRPVGITEIYYWMHISPAFSLITKSSDNLGILTEVGLLIPIWEKMVYDNSKSRHDFEIGGKFGWNFNLGLVRYLKENRTLKIVYFYENYGFKESPAISFDGTTAYEPASSTHNHGVKISFEKGFGA